MIYRNERPFSAVGAAASPIIGVFLMVAVTVVLAAVIGSFVFDIGEGVETDPEPSREEVLDGQIILVEETIDLDAVRD